MPFTIRLPFENKIAEPRQDRRVRNGVDPIEGRVSQEWALALTTLTDATQASATRLQAVSLIDQTASIAPTAMATGALPAGLYMVSFYAQIIIPGTVSSSLQVTIDWTTNAVPQSETSTALTTNAITSHQRDSMLVLVDENTPIRYSTTYASVGATAMQYSLYVVLTRVAA